MKGIESFGELIEDPKKAEEMAHASDLEHMEGIAYKNMSNEEAAKQLRMQNGDPQAEIKRIASQESAERRADDAETMAGERFDNRGISLPEFVGVSLHNKTMPELIALKAQTISFLRTADGQKIEQELFDFVNKIETEQFILARRKQ